MGHIIWLWLWFFIGMGLYMLKRAYYLVTGPNPVANNYNQFFQRCWLPLLVRVVIESVIFWACFNGNIVSQCLKAFGWENYAWAFSLVTKFAPMAFAFGHTIDSICDFLISKIPIIRDILPQMPPPLR